MPPNKAFIMKKNQDENKDNNNINEKEEEKSNANLFLLWYREIRDKVKGNLDHWKDHNYPGRKISKEVQIEMELKRIEHDRGTKEDSRRDKR